MALVKMEGWQGYKGCDKVYTHTSFPGENWLKMGKQLSFKTTLDFHHYLLKVLYGMVWYAMVW